MSINRTDIILPKPVPGGRILSFAGVLFLHLVVFWIAASFVIFPGPSVSDDTASFQRVSLPTKPASIPIPPPQGGADSTALPSTLAAPPPQVFDTGPVAQASFYVPSITLPDGSLLSGKMAAPGTKVGERSSGTNQGEGQGAGLGNGLGVQMTGLLFTLPCGLDRDCALTCESHVILKLADSTVHACTLRVRGLVEQASYSGGQGHGYLYTNGFHENDTYNVYQIEINDPPQVYFLNSGRSRIHSLFAVDYSFDIKIRDGSKISLKADSIDGKEIPNTDMTSIPDDDSPCRIKVQQPYAGQFIQVDAVSVR